MSTRIKQKSAIKWDMMYSTFYWKIHLDPNYEWNGQRNFQPWLFGYSKVCFQSEAEDKDYLLRKKIFNLFTNSYFKKMLKIEIWMRVDPIVDKKRDPKILILYPKHFDIPEDNYDYTYKRHGNFLHEFYDCLNAGKSVEHLQPKANNSVNKDEWLNIHKWNFSDVKALWAHANRLIYNGHPEGAVKHFMSEYKSLKGWT